MFLNIILLDLILQVVVILKYFFFYDFFFLAHIEFLSKHLSKKNKKTILSKVLIMSIIHIFSIFVEIYFQYFFDFKQKFLMDSLFY